MASGASWAEAWGPGVEAGPASSGGSGDTRGRRCGEGLKFVGRRWRPWELVAMIVGFVVFWPIGLAILFWKLWGADYMCRHKGEMREWRRERFKHAYRHGGLRRDSGNMAFDEYKAAELERLERERQRLADEQKAFGDFLNDLKRAKDREEFDRFMAGRGGPIIENGDGAPA
jgi:Protein of unknown function (DUF2852)